MLKNTKKSYGWIAIALHWSIALIIIGMLAFGFYMSSLNPFDPGVFELFQLHKSIGFTLLALVLVRLVNRFCMTTPRLPESMRPIERALAHLGHLGLYGLMLLMPITGWMMVSASPFNIPTIWFGLFEVPHLPVPAVLGDKEAASELMKTFHALGAFAFIAVILGHVLAALKHHLINKDGVLLRMLRPQQ
ncbi:cytochrome b [Polycladidibacter hongkongensis]|uniref:cytochrome b n=1 Tax=Polycladidibacter hongkongensis TaxID=1647556 RepID=UPI000837947F|nr:cytochrome b [Pseudovibrio hongkongensis]